MGEDRVNYFTAAVPSYPPDLFATAGTSFARRNLANFAPRISAICPQSAIKNIRDSAKINGIIDSNTTRYKVRFLSQYAITAPATKGIANPK